MDLLSYVFSNGDNLTVGLEFRIYDDSMLAIKKNNSTVMENLYLFQLIKKECGIFL